MTFKDGILSLNCGNVDAKELNLLNVLHNEAIEIHLETDYQSELPEIFQEFKNVKKNLYKRNKMGFQQLS